MTEPQEVPEPQPQEDEPVSAPEEGAAPGDDDEQAAEEEEESAHSDEPAELPPEQEQPPTSEKDIERNFRKLASAYNSYDRKVRDIMGEAAEELDKCPRCSDGVPGFIFPPMLAPVSEETKAAVLVSIGEPPPAASKYDPYTKGCATCDGQGVTFTGSRKNSQKTIDCIDCQGRGYVLEGDKRNRQVHELLPATAPAVDNGAHEPPPDVDLWGRPVGHPDYGKHPQYVR